MKKRIKKKKTTVFSSQSMMRQVSLIYGPPNVMARIAEAKRRAVQPRPDEGAVDGDKGDRPEKDDEE